MIRQNAGIAHIRLLLLLLILISAPASSQSMRAYGVHNPAVTQETIATTICVPGWTRGARPSSSYARRIKIALVHELEIPRDRLGDFELDHRVPLCLGGAPYEPANLELQPWDEADEKDRKEACLARAVCDGRLSLDEARRRIWSDWRSVGAGCD
jgi:hypothetical protein